MPNTPALSLSEDPVSSFGQAHDSSSLRTEGSGDTGHSGADVDTADGADGIALLARQAIGMVREQGSFPRLGESVAQAARAVRAMAGSLGGWHRPCIL